jgi:hypothetical protein
MKITFSYIMGKQKNCYHGEIGRKMLPCMAGEIGLKIEKTVPRTK